MRFGYFLRRAAPIGLAVAAMGPSGAAAQSLDETSCRDSTGLRSTCVGLGKLGERVSAECRRVGVVGEEQCWSRVGRRVIRAEVERYQDSWTHRALAFQYELGAELPFSSAPWVGTHNSYNSTSEDPTLSHTDSNQQLSLTEQLDLDVRSLEIDVHWLPSARAGGAFAPVVCHGEGPVGCTTERLLSEHLADVRAWLEANPGQVLLLYLEDQIDDAEGYAEAASAVEKALGERLYRPRQSGCNLLPLDLTRAAVLGSSARSRVVVVSDCGSGAWTGLVHSWPGSVRYEDRPRGYAAYPECGPPSAESAAKLVRYYEDSTFLTAAAAPTGRSSTDDGLTPATVEAMVRCGVDLFGFDQLLPGDGRLEALVWSWAEGEPSSGGGDCTVQRGDSRWERRSCSDRYLAACQAASGAWTVLGPAVKRKAAAGLCKESGLALGTPRTGNENARLRDAAVAQTVWLSHGGDGKKPVRSPRSRKSRARRHS